MNNGSTIPTNDAVSWSGTRFGFLPTLSHAAEAILEQEAAIIPILLEAILDPERFVTSHVLLTKITGIEYETFPSWNSLELNIAADGAVRIDQDQRQGLGQRWQRYFQAVPPPKALPPI